MNSEDKEKHIQILQGYLKYPGEDSTVDYKSAIAFKEGTDFSLKLIKHMLGIANIGGGKLVIGYEPKGLTPDEKMTTEIALSYEPTKLSKYVNSHIRGEEEMQFQVTQVPFDKKQYPVIEIQGFNKRPFFCKSSKNGSDGKEILKDGALYVRSSSTETIQLADPDEWEKLIDLCVKKRNDEMLERFQSLLTQAGLSTNVTGIKVISPTAEYDSWKDDARKEAEEEMAKNDFTKEYWEVSHCLIGSTQAWNQQEILDAMRKAERHNTGWPLGVVIYNESSKPVVTANGIKEIISSHRFFKGFDYWSLKTDGSFFFARSFSEDFVTIEQGPQRIMYFDTRIWRVAEAIDHCIALYKALDVNPTSSIKIEIRHKGIKDRVLTAANQMRAFTMWDGRKSGEDSTVWEKETTLDELELNRIAFVEETMKKMFILFDFWVPDPQIIPGVISEYEKGLR